MNELEKVSVNSEDVPLLVKGIVAKLLPKQLEWSGDYESAISQVSDFIKLNKVSYEADGKTKENFVIHMKNLTREVLENVRDTRVGESKPVYNLLELCNWGIVGHNLGISYKVNRKLVSVLDFEFYHYDYEKELKNQQDLPILDLIYFCQISKLGEILKSKKANNPSDARCKERITKQATREDIERQFADDESAKGLFLSILENRNKIGSSANVLTQDGKLLYVGEAPESPRRLHTFDEIKRFMSKDLESALVDYCTKEKWGIATAILYRRNRVKDFFGSDIRIPEQLVDYHKKFIGSLDPSYIKKGLDYLLETYTPSSLTYGLDIPSNFTKQEYTLFRFIQMYIDLYRMTRLVYDTPEKKQLARNINLPRLTLGD